MHVSNTPSAGIVVAQTIVKFELRVGIRQRDGILGRDRHTDICPPRPTVKLIGANRNKRTRREIDSTIKRSIRIGQADFCYPKIIRGA